MKNFALGPVEMFPYTLEIGAQQIPYFRTPEFSETMLESEQMLKDAVGAAPDAKVVFLSASGTAAMEATVVNCFTPQDKLLIINGGIFGRRFVEICDIHSIPYDTIDLSFGEVLSQEHMQPYNGKNYAALLVNIHETSTGQLYDIHMLSKFCKTNNMFLIVDAISSFMADTYQMKEYGIDATILSSQKGLAIAPGMAFVILSERLMEQRVSKIRSNTLYFDFMAHLENQKRGQTPYTPAVGTCLQLNDRLRHIHSEGLQNRLSYVDLMVKDFRSKLKEANIKFPDYPLSNACTPLLFEDGTATIIYETLKREDEIVLTPCGGDLKNLMVRVGHIGNHTIEENKLLIKALTRVISSLQGK